MKVEANELSRMIEVMDGALKKMVERENREYEKWKLIKWCCIRIPPMLVGISLLIMTLVLWLR